MKLLLPTLAILAMIFTVLATVIALVFCLSMGANSTPTQLRTLKLWMYGLSFLGGLSLLLGIILLRAGQPGWAAIAAFAPTILFGIILSVALLK